MTERISIEAIKAADRLVKPRDLETDAMTLAAFYHSQARAELRSYLEKKGLGDKAKDPIQTGMLGSMVRKLSGLYGYPAQRMLMRDGSILSHDSPEAKALAEVVDAMDLDIVWAEIDLLRILFSQVLVTFGENADDKEIAVRVFEPQNVFRMVNPAAADRLERDQAFALCLQANADPKLERYQLWQRDGEDWYYWVVTGGNEIVEDPYEANGSLVPFAELPAMLVTATKPLGRAWLPISQSRITMAQAIDGLANEILLLVKHQGHARQTLTTDNPGAVADITVGPDELLPLSASDKFEVHQLRPAIEDANRTYERFLSTLAVSEDLPADAFSSTPVGATGVTLKVRERDLEKRRQKYARIASKAEAKAYRKIAAILEVAGDELDLPALPTDARLIATFARQGQETDDKEFQEISFKELAIGTKSIIEHNADMRKVTRAESIALYQQTQEERERFPIAQTQEVVGEAVYTQTSQNPGALVSGPRPALGPGSAQKTPGAFNPDLGTSSEGASVTDAVRRAG